MTETPLNRNSTNFPLQLYEYLRNLNFSSEYSFLKYYQNIAREVVKMDLDSRGLLVYHTMGMGKSILAAAVIMDYILNPDKLKNNFGRVRQPIVLLSKSLQSNMAAAIKKYVKLRAAAEPDFFLGRLDDKDLDEWVLKNINFASLNASNMILQVKKAAARTPETAAELDKKMGDIVKYATLNGKLLIVDEAHNLFRAITNGSKNGKELYEMIIAARDLKILFFTGTPISNTPFELVPALNMLGSKLPGVKLFPENWFDFHKLYVDITGNIKNKEKFQNRIFGLVSHVTHTSQIGKNSNIKVPAAQVSFPKQLATTVEKVPMVANQYSMYLLARDKEKEENLRGGARNYDNIPGLIKPKTSFTSSYRVRSRQLSNFSPSEPYRELKSAETIPPEQVISPKFEKILENINKNLRRTGIVYSQFVGIGGLSSFARFLQGRGWDLIGSIVVDEAAEVDGGNDDENSRDEDDYYSDLIGTFNDTADIFVGGDEMSLLDDLQIGGSEPPPKTRKFAVISGAVDIEQRNEIVARFNADSNMYGDDIALLLISASGAEGLDLKNGGHGHIMEPYWTDIRHKQVEARINRNDSHIALPPELRTVRFYYYLSVAPFKVTEKSTDEELYEKSIIEQNTINSFNTTLKEAAIECLLNAGENCRSCQPTNKPLFTANVFNDMINSDPCIEYKVGKITATEMLFDGVKYYYKGNPDSVFGYSIFYYDTVINGYRRMPESDSRFAAISDAIKNKDENA